MPIKKKRKFNPEGSGYDYESARKAGLRVDETGHWPSRAPQSGQILKGRGHKTYGLTVQGEAKAGYEIYKAPSGKYFSRPKRKK